MGSSFKTGIDLIYSVALVSCVQQSNSVYIYIYKLYTFSYYTYTLSLTGYYKMLSIVPCAVQ